jgi:hypothetical protein
MAKSIVCKDLTSSSDNTYYVLSIALDYIGRKSGYFLAIGCNPWLSGKCGVPKIYDHPRPYTPLDEKLRTKPH